MVILTLILGFLSLKHKIPTPENHDTPTKQTDERQYEWVRHSIRDIGNQ
jgi:hypothetical protein